MMHLPKWGGKLKHIVSFSGGKDSTAMLLMMLEKGMPVDDIVCCDTGKEFPAMYEHWKKVEDYIGRKITILKAEHSYDYWMFDHVKTKGKRKGERGYGWANMLCRWCTKALKTSVLNNYHKGINDEVKEYVGIAYDERHRCKGKKYPLVDWQVTEKDALEYCYSKGFDWGGLYKHFDRVSCWCCPLKKMGELKMLYLHYPDIWKKLKDMDVKAYNQFKKNYSVEMLEEKFSKECRKVEEFPLFKEE